METIRKDILETPVEFLKGVGPDILWPQMAALLMLGATTLWVATRRFQKTIG